MAIREELTLDLSRALAQLDDLERQLDGLLQPINIPVRIETDQALDQLRRDIRAVDDTDINVDVDVDGVAAADAEFEQLNRELNQTDKELKEVENQADRTGRELDESSRKGSKGFAALTVGVGLLAAGLAAFSGGGALFRFFGDSIKSASNLEESLSKTRVVFGSLSDDIEAFASTGPQALGLANAAALEFTATFGNLFVALGLSQQAAADLAPDIVQLGSDLASFNNIEVTDSLDKLRAGLVGEAEPLRVLGVNLTAATTEAKAFELGLVGANGVVSEAAKVQARYALIVEQTATAQGDFARTADGIANQQRTLTAEFENLKTSIGQALLPAFQAILDIAPRLITDIRLMGESLAGFAQGAGEAAEGSVSFLDAIVSIPQRVGAVVDIVDGLGTAVFKAVEAFASIFSGPLSGEGFDPLIKNIEEGTGAIEGMIDSLEQRAVIEQFTSALKSGVDPAVAFANAVTSTAKVNKLTAAGFESLARVAGVTGPRLRDATVAMLKLGEAGAFSAEELQVLRNELTDIDNELRGGDIEALRFQNLDFQLAVLAGTADQAGTALEAVAEEAISLGDAIGILDGVASSSGASLVFVAQNAALFGDEVQAVVEQVGEGAIVNQAFAESFNRLIGSVAILDFSDAVEEFDLLLTKTTDAGKEVPTTVGEMLADLQQQANNFAEFEAGLIILESLGLTTLAADISARGIEAKGALDLFLADLPGAAEADRILREGGNPGEEFIKQVTDAIKAGDLTPSMLDLIAGFTSQANKNAVIDAGIATGKLFGDELQKYLDALNISLPMDIFVANVTDIGSIAGLPTPTAPSGGVGGGTTPSGGITGGSTPFSVNFYTEPNPTTDTARIVQALSGVTGGSQPI